MHLEGEAGLFCTCGAGGSVADLDAHFLAVFTPTDHIGRDGEKHELVSGSTAMDDRLSCGARVQMNRVPGIVAHENCEPDSSRHGARPVSAGKSQADAPDRAES